MNKLIFTLNSTYPILKFNFHSKILHVIFLIIFEGDPDFSGPFKYEMFSKKHVNLIVLEYSSFQTESMFYTFLTFTNNSCNMDPACNMCHIKSPDFDENSQIYVPEMEIVIKERLVPPNKLSMTMFMINEFPRSQMYSSIEYFGYTIQILKAFASFKNAFLEFRTATKLNNIEKSAQSIAHSNLNGIGFFIKFRSDISK